MAFWLFMKVYSPPSTNLVLVKPYFFFYPSLGLYDLKSMFYMEGENVWRCPLNALTGVSVSAVDADQLTGRYE